MHLRLLSACVAVVAVCAVLTSAYTPGDDLPQTHTLFTASSAPTTRGLNHFSIPRVGRVNAAPTPLSTYKTGDILYVELFEDVSFNAIIEDVPRLGGRAGTTVHVACILDTLKYTDSCDWRVTGRVIVTETKGVLSASVRMFADTSYHVLPSAEGEYVVRLLDHSALDTLEHGTIEKVSNFRDEHIGDVKVVPRPEPSKAELDEHRRFVIDPSVWVDILVVYTPRVRDELGGVEETEAMLTMLEAEANLILVNSEIDLQLHIVGSELVNYDETTDFDQMLADLDDETGALTPVATWKVTYGADLTSMFVFPEYGQNEDEVYCGVARPMTGSNQLTFGNQAVSVCSLSCLFDGATFMHEIAHNMGCNHQEDETTNPDPVDAYSYGYVWDSTMHGDVRTVMAYPPGVQIALLSNPDVKYLGDDAGVPLANNAQTIENTKNTVAGFRTQQVPPAQCNGEVTCPDSGDKCTVDVCLNTGECGTITNCPGDCWGNGDCCVDTCDCYPGYDLEADCYQGPLLVDLPEEGGSFETVKVTLEADENRYYFYPVRHPNDTESSVRFILEVGVTASEKVELVMADGYSPSTKSSGDFAYVEYDEGDEPFVRMYGKLEKGETRNIYFSIYNKDKCSIRTLVSLKYGTSIILYAIVGAAGLLTMGLCIYMCVHHCMRHMNDDELLEKDGDHPRSAPSRPEKSEPDMPKKSAPEPASTPEPASPPPAADAAEAQV